MPKFISRRELLQKAGTGLAAGVFSTTLGRAFAAEPQPAEKPAEYGAVSAAGSGSGPAPISLIIDDGSPVDPLFYELPGYETPFLVPAEFTRRVAEMFGSLRRRWRK